MSPEQKVELHAELLKIIVDKLLIAVIVLIVGFFANREIERFKANEAVATELSKTRVQKLSEVWEQIYSFEVAFAAASEDSQKKLVSGRPHEELAAAWEKMMPPLKQLVEVEQKNRFWLGNKEATAIAEYVQAATLNGIFASANIYPNIDKQQLAAAIKATQDRLDENRRNVISVVRDLEAGKW